MAGNETANRKPLMAANWKMNKTPSETEEFIKSFLSGLPRNTKPEVVVCPPFTSLGLAKSLLEGSLVALGAQNISEHEAGAYTGEVSGAMLSSLGCGYVIVGHSERRQYYGDTDALVNKKIQLILAQDLTPIVCVGESLQEREANKTLDVVSRQVRAALNGVPSIKTQKIVLAYEPIWAIGTGKTASTQQAQEVHLVIRDILKDQYGSLTSLKVRILYGGSVKPANIAELMACEDIDGALVGGASLDVKSFLSIVNYNGQ